MFEKEKNNQEDVFQDVENETVTHNTVTDDTHDKISRLQMELAEWKDKYVRIVADMDNMRRRSFEEQRLKIEGIEKSIFLSLLPIIDNFERALSIKNSDNAGMILIHDLFVKFLSKYQIIEIQQMKTFDPELHEAISQVVSPEKESGTIIEVFEKGYMLKNTILRYAKVSVVA